jgi:hypothetical protein
LPPQSVKCFTLRSAPSRHSGQCIDTDERSITQTTGTGTVQTMKKSLMDSGMRFFNFADRGNVLSR